MDPATLSLSRQQIPLGPFQTSRLSSVTASSSSSRPSQSLASRSKPLVVRMENEVRDLGCTLTMHFAIVQSESCSLQS